MKGNKNVRFITAGNFLPPAVLYKLVHSASRRLSRRCVSGIMSSSRAAVPQL